MDKGKKTLIITIGLICIILVASLFIQFNTIQRTDVANIKNLRDTELKAELASWNQKIEELEIQKQELTERQKEYETSIATGENTYELLEEDLNESKQLLGVTNVQGEGIIVTLDDNETKSIEAYDLLELVNELRLAGAEAISINGERVIANTEIVDINYSFIVVNGNRVSAPYEVKAIGNSAYLESQMAAKKYGYIDNIIKGNGKTASYISDEEIVIEKFKGDITLEHVYKGEE